MNPFDPSLFASIPQQPSDGTGQPSALGDQLELRRYLGQLGMANPVQPQLIPSPGLHLGPLHLSGQGLDSAALSVLGMLQGMQQPRGFGANFATGLATGLAGGRARMAQARGAANEAAVQSAAEQNKARAAEAARFLAQYRHDQAAAAREAATQAAITGRQQNKPESAVPVRGSAEWYDMLRKEAEARRAGGTAEQARLTPDQVDAWAEYALSTGKLPPLGLSANNPDRTAILAGAARKAKERGLSIAGNAAVYGGLKTSFGNMRKNYDSIEAFAKTALANSEILEGTLTKLVDTGSPIINKPIREWGRDVQGSIGVTAYNTARRIVAPEFARLLTSANAQGVLSDEARTEVMGLLAPDATASQVLQALDILKNEVANRRSSIGGQLGDIEDALNAVGQTPTTPNKPGEGKKSLADSWKAKH